MRQVGAESDAPATNRRPTPVAVARIRLALFAVAGPASLLAACGSSPDAEPPKAPKDFFGIVKGAVLDAQDAQTMRRGGVETLRFLLSWGAADPARGSFAWDATDQLVGDLAAEGIQPVPFVWGSPAWVAGEPARPPVDTTAQRSAWQDFLTAAVRRYGPGGTYWTLVYRSQHPDADPVPIRYWQIWNEPNLPKYFAPKSSADTYARLLRISHDAITAEDRGAKIVLAGLPGYGKPDTAWKFLDKLYGRHGFKSAYDAVALHPYALTVAQLKFEIERLRSAMQKHGDGRTPLWLTELGWGSRKPDRFGLNKGLGGQKRLLSDSFRLILGRRAGWHVERLFWFDWRDPPTSEPQQCSFCSSAGLLKFNRDPKPAWDAYKRFATG